MFEFDGILLKPYLLQPCFHVAGGPGNPGLRRVRRGQDRDGEDPHGAPGTHRLLRRQLAHRAHRRVQPAPGVLRQRADGAQRQLQPLRQVHRAGAQRPLPPRGLQVPDVPAREVPRRGPGQGRAELPHLLPDAGLHRGGAQVLRPREHVPHPGHHALHAPGRVEDRHDRGPVGRRALQADAKGAGARGRRGRDPDEAPRRPGHRPAPRPAGVHGRRRGGVAGLGDFKDTLFAFLRTIL